AVRRLWVYAVVIVLLSLLGVVVELAVEVIHAGQLSTSGAGWLALQRTMENSGALGPLIVMTFVPPLWAFFTYWAPMIFGTSMEVARVNTSHVKRCVIYSLDVCVWYGLFVALAAL